MYWVRTTSVAVQPSSAGWPDSGHPSAAQTSSAPPSGSGSDRRAASACQARISERRAVSTSALSPSPTNQSRDAGGESQPQPTVASPIDQIRILVDQSTS